MIKILCFYEEYRFDSIYWKYELQWSFLIFSFFFFRLSLVCAPCFFASLNIFFMNKFCSNLSQCINKTGMFNLSIFGTSLDFFLFFCSLNGYQGCFFSRKRYFVQGDQFDSSGQQWKFSFIVLSMLFRKHDEYYQDCSHLFVKRWAI